MNDIIKTVYERRSVRKYKSLSVQTGIIDQIINAGKMAPTAMNRQSWKFYVVTNKEQIKKLSKEIVTIAAGEIKHIGIREQLKMTLSFFHFSTIINLLTNDDHVFYGAPVVIFITTPADNEWGALDTGMCVQNMMLAARSLGLDSCPVGFGRFVTKTKDYYTLGIPATEEVQLALIIGHGDEHPKPHDRVENNVMYL